MSVTAKTLIQSQFAPLTAAALYTVPAGTRTIIDKFTATNTSGGAQTITVNLVPSGQGAGLANQFTSALSIAAGGAVDLTELKNQVLEAGDFINVSCNGSGKIAVRASGRETVT